MGSRQPPRMTDLSGGGNSEGCFFKEDAVVVVAQFTNFHQVVMVVRHFVDALGGELQEEQVT